MGLDKISRLFKEEERRFIDYASIEATTRDRGFPISVRTLRFYVDEGVLPAPRKRGKTPVYEADWILNVLLSIHIMKTRFGRSLREIRLILGGLEEPPETLAHLLSLLYEDFVASDRLKPVERDWLVTSVFDRLTGRLGHRAQPSELELDRDCQILEAEGRWESTAAGMEWRAPPREALLESPGRIKVRVRPKPGQVEGGLRITKARRVGGDVAPEPSAPSLDVTTHRDPRGYVVVTLAGALDDRAGYALLSELDGLALRSSERLAFDVAALESASIEGLESLFEASREVCGETLDRALLYQARPELRRLLEAAPWDGRFELSTELDEALIEIPSGEERVVDLPDGAVSLEAARGVEEVFLGRFESALMLRSQVMNPLEGKALALTAKALAPIKRDHSASIIQLMKSRQIYDRALLDSIPLERASEFHVYRRGFFGRGELKVVLAAISLSPVEQCLTERYASRPLGVVDIQKAIAELVVQEDIFYYVGLLSTTGWDAEARAGAPQARNLLCCLISKDQATAWSKVGLGDDRWGEVAELFDPETATEKVERAKAYLKGSVKLQLRGGHLVLANVEEDLGLDSGALRRGIEELLAEDSQLSLEVVAGHEIIKRARF